MVKQQSSDSSVTKAHLQGRNRQHFTASYNATTRYQTIERATRHFYTRLQDERLAFLAQIQGLPDHSTRETYVSLLLSRLIFLYFLQKKGFLDNDTDYLGNRLQIIRQHPGHDTFYRSFLLRLFHEGLSKPERTSEQQALLGNVPYLGGDLFTVHTVERSYPALAIPDQAFIRLFAYFDKYRWVLHENSLEDEKDVTPEVLGYALEQYVNQAQMGAYYTGADVTAYIARNTIIPYLFDSVSQLYPKALQPGAPLWQMLQSTPERYIYHAMSSKRPLPGETSTEYADRSASCTRLRSLLQAGKLQSIDDLITYNLDICQFAQDVLLHITDNILLYAFYASLRDLTVLDPTCGSGAFLLAALHVLEPLYATCLERMQELAHTSALPPECNELLEQMQACPDRHYFIRKIIITQHLYGVDLMEEAITACKLRLFLALIARIGHIADLEPLPDIDTHLRVGNALVGDLRSRQTKTQNTSPETGAVYAHPHSEQDAEHDTESQGTESETEHVPCSTQAFHWDCEFTEVMRQGGFSVILGNPPYVEYNHKHFPYKLQNFVTLACANLYPCIVERSYQLLSANGRSGMILPLSAFATRNMIPLLDGFLNWFPCSWLSFYHFRPSMLFSGHKAANIPTAIYLAKVHGATQRFSTGLHKWQSINREQLFTQLSYCPITVERDPANRHYYPKFRHTLENAIMHKVQQHTCVHQYLSASPNDNTMYYRSAGGLYWKVFINFAWPYHTTSNKQCSFLPAYDRDVFVALFNSSLFWWYYTVTFDSFNLKDYMLFGFRFTYPDDELITSALQIHCQALMQNFRQHAKHLTRSHTGSYTIYARKAKAIIDEIDRTLARQYGFSTAELNFILNYDIKYRVGQS
jgi:tRNA1(Val) A37 N6-methylase TrmN6